MKKFITSVLYTTICIFAYFPANAELCCIVNDIFVGKCPTAEDLDWGSAAPDPKCFCTHGNPPLCKMTEIFSRCPDGTVAGQYIKDCTCTECQGGGGGTGTGGGSLLPCTACDEVGWQSNGTGYEIKKTGGTCSGNTSSYHGTCKGQTIEYRCAPGYCGTTTDGKTGCVKADYEDFLVNCRVTDKFENECPSGVTNCICTNTYPKICTVLDIFDTPPSWAQNYFCGTNYWVSTATGHEQNKIVNIEGESCTSFSQSYRCSAGYYGSTTNGTSGCSKCPIPGTSLAGQNSAIGQCYIPSNTPQTDTTGQYIYSSNCYYTN